MSILLTREENLEVWNDCGDGSTWGEYAEMLNKAQLKRVAKWGDESCREHNYQQRRDTLGILKRRECSLCWQELSKEAGIK